MNTPARLSPHAAPRPRVMQFITHLALGGAERVAMSLMRGLRDQCDFAVFAANGIDPGQVGQAMRRELIELNIPLFVGTNLPIKAGGMLLAGLGAGRAVRSFRPDIIHLHTEIPESAYATMVTLDRALSQIAVVRTIHNVVYWDPWRRLGRWCDRRMSRSYVACVSHDAVGAFRQLRAESGAGQTPAPPIVIYNGVSVDEQPRPIDRMPGTRIRILFAGRFEDQKGTDLLPQIVRAVRLPPGRTCELIIHGSGTHEPMLRALAADPPPDWCIQVCGPVPDLRRRMKDFDLLIMPSRYEGLGLVAIEAILLNLPVVATDAAGLREALPPAYPWRARAGDAHGFAQLLQRALEQPGSWAAAVRQAQDHARRRFDPSAMCAGYLKLYHTATKGSGVFSGGGKDSRPLFD